MFTYTMTPADVEAMKEKFANLLLGEDVTGGAHGFATALALSHAITNLSGMFLIYHSFIHLFFRISVFMCPS